MGSLDHRHLLSELRHAVPYARHHGGMLPATPYWTGLEAEFAHDAKAFLKHHRCKVLDRLVERDSGLPYHHQPIGTLGPCPSGIPPVAVVDQPSAMPGPSPVPEPASLFATSIGIVMSLALIALTCPPMRIRRR